MLYSHYNLVVKVKLIHFFPILLIINNFFCDLLKQFMHFTNKQIR